MKQLLVRLKRTLLFRTTKDYIYLYTIGLVLFIYLIFNLNFLNIIILIIYILFTIINNYRLTMVMVVIMLLTFFNILVRKSIYSSIDYGQIKVYAQIIDIKETTKSKQITISSQYLKYIFYEEKDIYKVGDKIEISGLLIPGDSAPSINLFDYQTYLELNNIKGIIQDPSVKVVSNCFCLAKINQKLQTYFDKHFSPLSKGYLEALLIGYKDNIDNEMNDNIKEIGISHLFVISGLHMGIIVIVLKKLMTMLKIKDNYQFYLILCFFILYYIITLFSLSILRVMIVFIISNMNKKYHLKLKPINIYALSITSILIIQPYYLFSYAFMLTFLTSMSLVFISPFLKNKGFKSFLLNNIIISLNSIVVTLPVVTSINPEINILSVLYNLFYIPFVTYLMLPLSFIVAVLPFFKGFYEIVVKGFNYITIGLARIDILRISFPKISIIIIIIYYLLYISIVICRINQKNKKCITLVCTMLILLFFWSNKQIFNSNNEIIFMNLPIGESTLIVKAFNQANILIDTGDNKKDDLEIFLMKKGIKRLDYVFISHSDSDHNGKLHILIQKFNIKNVVITPYDQETLKLLKNYKYKGNIIMMKRNDEIKFQNIIFKALLPDNAADNSNDNSLVLKIMAFDYSILLTGDISKTKEESLIKYEKNINVNFFKVPHHGSNTSSSDNLLAHLKYDYAICMNGYLNRYSFPTNKTIDKYDSEKLFITSNTKTIIIKVPIYRKKKLRFSF